MHAAKQSYPYTEKTLVNMASKGNLDAFNELVLTYQDLAYHHAYGLLRDPALADDATHDSFLRAFQHITEFRGGSFRAWILKIVTNSAYDMLRRSKRHPTQSLYPEDEYGDEVESPVWLADSSSVQDTAEQSGREQVQRRLLWLMAVSDQTSTSVDESVNRAAMASVLDLRNVLELVDRAFNDGPFSKKELIHPGHQTVLHILSEFGNEPQVESLQKLLKESLGNIPTICDQLTKQPFAQIRYWCTVVGAGSHDLTSQQFTTIINH